MSHRTTTRTVNWSRRLALALAGVAGLGFLAGCSSYTAPPALTSGEKRALQNFNLGRCQQLEPGLYRCPTSDKVLCTPGFARTDVECVHVDATGVILRQEGM